MTYHVRCDSVIELGFPAIVSTNAACRREFEIGIKVGCRRKKILISTDTFIGIFHFVLIPSIYSGTDPSYFYSINGLGIPISGTLLPVWIFVISIMLLRKKV
jgi:hypothetical protein